ncbi:MAG: symporter small accessory protein [Saccharofermentanales bacterium]
MLNLGDFSIFAVYILCILAAVTCVIYGIFNWNKGSEPAQDADKKWQDTEKTISEDLEI